MKLPILFFGILLSSLFCQVQGKQHVQGKRALLEDYSGPQFFSKMDFFSDPDPTEGHVQYLDLETANATGLAGLFPSMHSNETVYLGTDYSNKAPQRRPSIRVSSQRTYDSGLFIAEISHMPGGVCGTWPALWLLGSSAPWPEAGEVDIIEGINDDTDNTMALHVSGSFNVTVDPASMLAKLESTDADVNAPNQPPNKGAVAVSPKDSTTFGSAFNDQMGGVYATEVSLTEKRITIWFFPRGNIPEDVLSDDPHPSNWGTPLANFAGSDLDFSEKFKKLQIVINLTFCGQWAGNPSLWGAFSCAKLADTCEAYVADNPAAFEDMYWAINSLRVFEADRSGPESLNGGGDTLAIPTSAPTGESRESIPRIPYINNAIAVPSAEAAAPSESIPRIPYNNNAAAIPSESAPRATNLPPPAGGARPTGISSGFGCYSNRNSTGSRNGSTFHTGRPQPPHRTGADGQGFRGFHASPSPFTTLTIPTASAVQVRQLDNRPNSETDRDTAGARAQQLQGEGGFGGRFRNQTSGSEGAESPTRTTSGEGRRPMNGALPSGGRREGGARPTDSSGGGRGRHGQGGFRQSGRNRTIPDGDEDE